MTKETYSIKDAFDLLAKAVELSLADYTKIANAQAGIEEYLAQYISTFSTVLPGAFARRTMVSPLAGSVVDMYIVFEHRQSENFFPTELLEKLHITLADEYDGVSYSKMNNVITVPMEKFRFKVRPAFVGEHHIYYVPSSSWNEWVEYDSFNYKQWLHKEDIKHEGKLFPLIRMIKTWNQLTGSVFDGYYLELLVIEVMKDYKITSYSEAVRRIFQSALSEVRFQKGDPANTSMHVDGVPDVENLVKAMLEFQEAYKIATHAVALEKSKSTDQAMVEWGKLFPHSFPTAADMIIGKLQKKGIKGSEALRLMTKSLE